MTPLLVTCDGARLPAQRRRGEFARELVLDHRGPVANLNFSVTTPSDALLAHVQGRALDLLRIAGYAYGADQAVQRSSDVDMYGDRWKRDFTLCLPVSDLDFWRWPPAQEALCRALGFASGDRWAFEFTPALAEQQQLAFAPDADTALGAADCVMLFSGGLDSLCAVVEAARMGKRRPLLVGHRPARVVGTRQMRALRALREQFSGEWHFPLVSAAIHRMAGKDPREYTQRTRPFLFSVLGAVVARILKLDEVALADNGIVSINLPINAQLVGTTASRSTHPKVLRLINTLVQLVFEQPPTVLNPLWERTRADGLELLKQADASPLIAATNSCSRVRGLTQVEPHCGQCSQCIDRRMATVAAELEQFDPGTGYELDIFRDPLPRGKARTMVLSYIGFAQDVLHLDRQALFLQFPELYECIAPDDPDPVDTAERYARLVQRHAQTVLGAVSAEFSRRSAVLMREKSPEPTLLRLVATPAGEFRRPRRSQSADPQPAAELLREAEQPQYLFRRSGDFWTLRFGGAVTRLKHSKGLELIHELLRQPGKQYLALDLARAIDGEAASPDASMYRGMSAAQLAEEGMASAERASRQEVIDEHALEEYRRACAEIREQLLQAEWGNDLDHVAALQDRLAWLEGQIKEAQSIGGRSRIFADAAEKARQAVRQDISAALRRIERSDPPLAKFLRSAIRTGRSCVYQPDREIPWVC